MDAVGKAVELHDGFSVILGLDPGIHDIRGACGFSFGGAKAHRLWFQTYKREAVHVCLTLFIFAGMTGERAGMTEMLSFEHTLKAALVGKVPKAEIKGPLAIMYVLFDRDQPNRSRIILQYTDKNSRLHHNGTLPAKGRGTQHEKIRSIFDTRPEAIKINPMRKSRIA